MAEEELDQTAPEPEPIGEPVAPDASVAADESDAPEDTAAPSPLTQVIAKVGPVVNSVQGSLANPDTRRFLAGALVGALVLFAGGTVFDSGDQSGNAEVQVEALRADLAELRADLAELGAAGGGASTDGGDHDAPTDDHATDETQRHDDDTESHDDDTESHDDDTESHDDDTESHDDDAGSHGDDPESQADGPPHWTYAEADDWARLADEYIECAEGTEQSPIDLSSEWDKVDSTTELDYDAVPVTVVDNGHTIQVNAKGAGSVSQQRHEYDLEQFHFHAPSEHTIDGKHHAAEVHLVHVDADGKLAVVGIMIDEGAALEGFDPILDAIGAPTVEADAGNFDPSMLLPKTPDFFHYRGSLTTPPCTEGVAWRVMAEPITMSAAQLDELQSHFVEENNRPVQPRNGRDAHIDVV